MKNIKLGFKKKFLDHWGCYCWIAEWIPCEGDNAIPNSKFKISIFPRDTYGPKEEQIKYKGKWEVFATLDDIKALSTSLHDSPEDAAKYAITKLREWLMDSVKYIDKIDIEDVDWTFGGWEKVKNE